jgi:ABC-type transporter Mla subunit MlaD
MRAKSDEVLAEADRLDAIERTLDALPEGSQEIVETAQHAEGQAARLREVAAEDRVMTREVVEQDADPTRQKG